MFFSANNTRKYVDVLDLLVDQYNNTIYSLIKMTPKEASRKENGVPGQYKLIFFHKFGFCVHLFQAECGNISSVFLKFVQPIRVLFKKK